MGSDWKSQQTSMLFSQRIMTVESRMGKTNRKEKYTHTHMLSKEAPLYLLLL